MYELLWKYWPWWVAILMVLAATALLRLLRGRRELPYARRKRLLTNPELRFYRVLRQAVNQEWEVFAMVRIADLLVLPPGTRDTRSWLNRILSKHIDFVICDRESLEILVAIELDDPSHLRPERVERDAFVNAALADAGLPLLRFPVAESYDAKPIRSRLVAAIES